MGLTELQKFQAHVLVDLKVPNLKMSPPDILADVTDVVMARQYGYKRTHHGFFCNSDSLENNRGLAK